MCLSRRAACVEEVARSAAVGVDSRTCCALVLVRHSGEIRRISSPPISHT